MIMFVLYSYTMGKKAHGEGHSHDEKPELPTPLARPPYFGNAFTFGALCATQNGQT